MSYYIAKIYRNDSLETLVEFNTWKHASEFLDLQSQVGDSVEIWRVDEDFEIEVTDRDVLPSAYSYKYEMSEEDMEIIF
jgi:hypothetical protein